MDFNLFVIAGTIAADPEHRSFDSGASLIRYLVTTRSTEPRRRIDVLPITLWNPGDDVPTLTHGDGIWVVGSAQRRFWDTGDGRRSRLELVARHVELRNPDISEETGTG